jgi:hypothetical protein
MAYSDVSSQYLGESQWLPQPVTGVEGFFSAPGLRAGLFNDLSVWDACPLRILDFVGLRFLPLISHEKTAPSRQ